MANEEHVAILKKGVATWNAWRDENPTIHPNLSEANLSGANLSGANLIGVNLGKTDLSGAHLSRTNLYEADLQAALLIDTDFSGADLTGCRIHGVSAWGLKVEGAKQQDLVITRSARDLAITRYARGRAAVSNPYQLLYQPEITVDSIEVAQFVYLLLHNEKIREVIDTIGKKGVLLLGRFTEGRMVVLKRLREKLRELGYVPMVFNFDKPETKDFTETVRLLARACTHKITIGGAA